MGNCIRHESAMTWAGEDWGSPAGSVRLCRRGRRRGGRVFDKADQETSEMEKERLLGGKIGGVSSPSSSTTEVKIKISKKQLEELLGTVDLQGLPVDQVMARLVKVSDKFETQHRPWVPWRPALQSIPEVN